MREIAAERWAGMPRDHLVGRWVVPEVRLFDTVASTNEVARRLAADGVAPGTVVLADRQLAGRGRAGRRWDSPAGLGLWLSMVAPPPTDPASAGALPLRVGVAVARALDRFVPPARIGIKWPNDLILGKRKVGGILCEGTWEGSVAGPVVVGLGLNLLQRESDFPPSVRGSAISLAMGAPEIVARLAVADAVVPALWAAVAGDPLPRQELAAELERRDVLRAVAVTVTDPSSGQALQSGVAMGIAPDGALLMRDAQGVLRTVRSGTVRPSAPAGPCLQPRART